MTAFLGSLRTYQNGVINSDQMCRGAKQPYVCGWPNIAGLSWQTIVTHTICWAHWIPSVRREGFAR